MAAGSSSRMGGTDKLFCDYGGRPVIFRTAEVFSRFGETERIVIVTRREAFGQIEAALAGLPVPFTLAEGGASRAESVANGLKTVPDGCYVAVHDGARPFVTPDVIARTLDAAKRYGAAIPAIAVKDTIKEVGRDGFVAATPVRSALRAVQTPQIFRSEALRAAYAAVPPELLSELTDDSSVMERFGRRVYVVEGDERNVKLTTPRDLETLK